VPDWQQGFVSVLNDHAMRGVRIAAVATLIGLEPSREFYLTESVDKSVGSS